MKYVTYMILNLLLMVTAANASYKNLFKTEVQKELKTIKEIQRKVGEMNISQIKIKFNDYIIDIESKNPLSKISKDYQTDYFSQVKRNYDSGATPYPGEVTALSGCEKKFSAKVITINKKKVLAAFLSENGGFGACLKDEVFSLSCNWFQEEKETNTLNKIKLIIKKTQKCEDVIEKLFF